MQERFIKKNKKNWPFFWFGVPVNEYMLDMSVSSRAAAPRRLGPPCLPHPFFCLGLFFFFPFWQSPPNPAPSPFSALISCRRYELSFVTITPDDMHMFCEHPHAKGSNKGTILQKENDSRKCVSLETLPSLKMMQNEDQNAALLL